MKSVIKSTYLLIFFCILSIFSFCSKKTVANSSPVASISASMISTDPQFTFKFTVTASDQDLDPLKYSWDFGEGTTKEGGLSESFSYPENKQFTIKVKVSDGKSTPTEVSTTINTSITDVTINTSVKFQTMEGFGGFGAQDVYWSNGPFTSTEFVNNMVNDLGVTIIRDELPTSFEITNDNNDPFVTDLSKYNINTEVSGHHKPLGARLEHLSAMKAAGIKIFIASVWSPPPWMKNNDRLDNGTTQNSAPPYTTSPGSSSNQLRTDMYDEFAEMCVAYVKILKQEAKIDLYALSIQNEPRFSQSYQSCVYNGAAMHDLVKVVGSRFKSEGLSTKLFLPEDIGYLQGVEGMVKPSLDDAVSRQYVDIVAVHGYDLDGATAASPDAQTWQTMDSWGSAYGKPLWMTETSGFANNYPGAIALAKAMFTAIKYGKVSAWVFWSLSTETLDEYSLISSSGMKSKRFYVSKNFYRYIRPGAERIDVQAAEESKVFPLAFQNSTEGSTTLVLINDNSSTGKPIRLKGAGLPADFQMLVTSPDDNCKDYGKVDALKTILLPANSVVTLYHKN